jgi:hypothetical protein
MMAPDEFATMFVCLADAGGTEILTTTRRSREAIANKLTMAKSQSCQ